MNRHAGQTLPEGPVAPHAHAAARLRAERSAIAARAVPAAAARDPGLVERHGAATLRLFARDADRHVEQLARALEEGRDAPAVEYASWIVPVMRRRGVSMGDLGTLFRGVGDAARAVVEADAGAEIEQLAEAMAAVLDRPRHLQGDRPRNPLVAFFWKASGFAGW